MQFETTNPKVVSAIKATAYACAKHWLEVVDCEQWQQNAKSNSKDPLKLNLDESDYIALAKMCSIVAPGMTEDEQELTVDEFEEYAQIEWRKQLEELGWLKKFEMPEELGVEYVHWTGAGIFTLWASDSGDELEMDQFFVTDQEYSPYPSYTFRKNGEVWEKELAGGRHGRHASEWMVISEETLREEVRSALEQEIENALEGM